MSYDLSQLSRRGFLGAPAAATAAAAQTPPSGGRRPPNILYIMTDQQHAGMMSCTDNERVKTPAMDSLAARGVRFELAYAANPVCMPARTSMMTGCYPSRFNMQTNGPADVPPQMLPQAMGNLFRKAGYHTVFGGKTHWPQPMTPASIGFDYISADERDELSGACVDFLRQKQDRPFLLVASFINPHDICYMAIDAFTSATNRPAMYPESVVERRRVAEALATAPQQLDQLPPLPGNHKPTVGEPAKLDRYTSFRGWARENWTEQDWRRHRWAYARLTERVDAEIARLLAALHDTGHDRDTVVVFASDHGDMDAAHGFEHKSLPYEESARVPFIVCEPQGQSRVDRRHLINASTDLLPTLCDYAGIAAPPGLPGRSVRPLVSGRPAASTATAVPWRDHVVIECVDSRSVRTSRYKYSIFEGAEPRQMLIDMEKDPGEMRNLAAEPAQAPVVAAHRALLESHAAQWGDRFGASLLS